MKLKTSKKEIPYLDFTQCKIGEVYSQTTKIGQREATNYYMKSQPGMINLETGVFIPAVAYCSPQGSYFGLRFVHVPDATFSL